MTFGHRWGDDGAVITGIAKGAARRPWCFCTVRTVRSLRDAVWVGDEVGHWVGWR